MFGSNECKGTGPFCAVALHTDAALQRKAAHSPEALCAILPVKSPNKQQSVRLRTTCVSSPNYFPSRAGFCLEFTLMRWPEYMLHDVTELTFGQTPGTPLVASRGMVCFDWLARDGSRSECSHFRRTYPGCLSDTCRKHHKTKTLVVISTCV